MNYVLALGILSISGYTDWKEYKIYNKPLLICLVLNILYHVYANGLPGLQASLLGLFAGLFILLPGYIMGAIGAGDVKLFGVLGSIMGLKFLSSMTFWFVIYLTIWSFILLLVNKRLAATLKWTGEYLVYIFTKVVTVGIKECEKPIVQEGIKIKCGLIIVVAALTAMIIGG